MAARMTIGMVAVAACVTALGATQGAATPPTAQVPDLRGPYMGQKPPGRTPERFAPGIVSVKGPDSVPRFSPDGQEVYWSHVGPTGGIFRSRVQNGRWTSPEPVALGAGGMNALPFLFDGGRRLFFLSTRPLPDGRRPQPTFFTFWIATRLGGKWGSPSPIDSFFSGWDDLSAMAEDGTLFLSAGQKDRVRTAGSARRTSTSRSGSRAGCGARRSTWGRRSTPGPSSTSPR